MSAVLVAITTSNSISVNAALCLCGDMGILPLAFGIFEAGRRSSTRQRPLSYTPFPLRAHQPVKFFVRRRCRFV
jgi:hypothetical protein